MDEKLMRADLVRPEGRDKLAAVKRRLDRLSKTAKINSYITPFPVSSYAAGIPDDGVVLRYMFPGSGRISNACLYIEGKIEKKSNIFLAARSITPKDVSTGTKIPIVRNFNQIGLDLAVSAGDRTEMVITSDMEISGIWIAFLWLPAVGDVEIKKFLQGELTMIADGEDEEL